MCFVDPVLVIVLIKFKNIKTRRALVLHATSGCERRQAPLLCQLVRTFIKRRRSEQEVKSQSIAAVA